MARFLVKNQTGSLGVIRTTDSARPARDDLDPGNVNKNFIMFKSLNDEERAEALGLGSEEERQAIEKLMAYLNTPAKVKSGNLGASTTADSLTQHRLRETARNQQFADSMKNFWDGKVGGGW